MRRIANRAFWTMRFFVVVAALASAHAGTTAAQALSNEIAKFIAQPLYKESSWGLLVVDLDSGETLYELNPDKLFVPASTTKLFSVAAALEVLGADHRFHTPVYARGEIDAEGKLQGDLILAASGDLTLGGRTDAAGRIAFADADHTYAGFSPGAKVTESDPLAGLKAIAQQVKQAGIHEIDGDVLIDDRLFEEADSSGSGPDRCSPIVVNDNVIDVTVEPGKVGELAKVTCRPECSAVVVDARVLTVDADQETELKIELLDERGLLVRGRIAADEPAALRPIEVKSPEDFARRLLIDALQEAGIAVDASAVSCNCDDALPDVADYAQLKQVAQLESPPFSENARLILKVSHNLHASTLPLLMAAKQGQRTLDEGLKIEREALTRIGVDVDTISFGGGAGGTRADFVTPRAAVNLLRAMSQRPEASIYRDALPILGVDGTLHSAVEPESPARAKFQAKTGTLVWQNGLNDRQLLTSKALAGYGETASGRKIAVAIFVNNVHLRDEITPTYVGKHLGKLCELIHAGL